MYSKYFIIILNNNKMDFTSYTYDSNPMVRLIKQSIVFGLLFIIFGHISSKIVKPYFKVDLPEVCKSWNKKYLMEASLFTTGFLAFFVIQYFNVKI